MNDREDPVGWMAASGCGRAEEMINIKHVK